MGGTDVFRPRVEIPNLGLLSAHLLVARNNVHYFLASDYNIYAYYGGSVLEPIGDKIRDQLVDDIEPEYIHRCWMALGPQNKTLWLFIVPPDGQYITTAYVMDLRTKAWMKRDFSQLFTDSRTGGLTSINLVSGETYTVGQTYRDWLQRYSPHDVGDATQVVKYGDALKGTEISEYLETSHTLDFSSGTWEAGGCCYSLAGATFNAEMTDNWILEVVDGSQGTNVEPGDHYYTLTEVSSECFRVIPRFDGTEGEPAYSVDFSNGGPYEITIHTILYDSDTTTKTCKVRTVAKMGAGTWAGADATGRLWVISKTGADFAANALIKRNSDDQTICNFHGDPTLLGRLGIADGSGATPADMSIVADLAGKVIFNIWAVEVDEADTTDTLDSTWNYRSDVETVRTQERMLAGDASGFVYEFSDSLTTDDGVVPDAYHYTPVFDLQQPDKLKRWDEFVLTAKGDFCRVEYSIDDGATWTECAMFTLTSTWDDYHFFVPRTSERIQFRISNTYSTTNLVNDPAFESDANTSTDTYWDKYIWSTDPVTLRITKSTSATPTTFVWAYLGESTETLDPDDYAVAAQADDLRVYPGIRYRLRYRLYARTDAAVSFCTAVTPQLAGVQGTEVTVSITHDDWTQKTDYITAGNRKDLKFSAMLDTTLTSYVHSLDVLALSDISLIPAPSAQTFEIREMKAVNIQFVDSR